MEAFNLYLVKSLPILVHEFEFQSRDYTHFRFNSITKDINMFITPAIGWIVQVVLFYKKSFDINNPRKLICH